jgi:hypothetical protein
LSKGIQLLTLDHPPFPTGPMIQDNWLIAVSLIIGLLLPRTAQSR